MSEEADLSSMRMPGKSQHCSCSSCIIKKIRMMGQHDKYCSGWDFLAGLLHILRCTNMDNPLREWIIHPGKVKRRNTLMHQTAAVAQLMYFRSAQRFCYSFGIPIIFVITPYIIDSIRKPVCKAVQEPGCFIIYCILRTVKQIPRNDQHLRPLAWSPDVPELGNAELVCLAHAGTNPEAPCFGFFFWVQFCQWTLEVQVSTDGVPVESEIVRAVAESAISGTMADVGC